MNPTDDYFLRAELAYRQERMTVPTRLRPPRRRRSRQGGRTGHR